MEQKRKFQRFPIEITAQCFGAAEHNITSCTITEISRAGVIINLCLKGTVKAGQSLMLEIVLPGATKPISALVKLKWVSGNAEEVPESHCAAGGKLTMIKPDDKKRLLEYAYACLLSREREA